jgi:HAE1 family hydrophobic/amphiphilic exporter-1
MNLSRPFIFHPVATVLLVASAALFGVLAYRSLPVSDLPAADYPVIQVNVAYPGASPDTMANNVATPLEQQFLQIPALDQITSASTQGQTTLTLQFALSKSLDAAATDVQAAISRAAGQLPPDLPNPPTFTKTNPNDQPILYLGLVSDTVTSGELYDYAKIQVGQRISVLAGVSQVAVYGAQPAVRIKADPSALAARRLTMDDLAAAIRANTSYQGAGQIDGPHRSFLLQPMGQLSEPGGYESIIITTRGGSPIQMGDVARAVESVQDERVKMRFWLREVGEPSATVVVAVFRQAGANAVEVSRSVRDLLPLIGRELPPSVTLLAIHDRSETIIHSVADVQATLLIAFVLVVIVIFLFLGRARDTLIPALAIPMSLLITLIVMGALGYSLDNLSLMGLTLVIGFLVDDAIVFLENTVRRMEQFNESRLQATLNSAGEISLTILSMTVSLAAVFIPLVFMGGLIGRIFREFSITIVVAILASGLVSLTLTPMMCSRILVQRGRGERPSRTERISGAILRGVLGVYGWSLWWFLRRRWVAAAIWALCMVGTVWLFMRVPQTFLPVGDSSFIRGVVIAQEGSSPQQMYDYQQAVQEALHSNPSVRMTFTMVASSRFNSNQGLVLVFLKPPGRRAPIEQLTGQLMGQASSASPGLLTLLQPDPVLRISTGATASQQGKYAFAISGIKPQEVYAAAERLMGEFRRYPGFATVSSDLFNRTPQLEINILRDQARTYGVSPTRILNLLRNAYSQNYVYLIKQPNQQYQVILEVKDSQRAEPADLGLLYISSDDGQRVLPLSAVATWQPSVGPQSVNHIDQLTSVTFFFNLKPDVSLGEATDYIQNAARRTLPPTVAGSLQGEALTFQETVRSLVVLMFLAVFVMYVVLGILYESYLHPITVLSALPVAMVGGLAALWVFGQQASLYAFIGLFMLMGIVKKNGILIVDFALDRIAQGRRPIEAIHDASMDRFRPIIMTTLAAMMGAVPIAVGYGADAASRRPLGLVVVGGLLVSQFITLYITPAIYLYLQGFQEKVLDRSDFFRAGRRGPQEPPDEPARAT